MTGLPLPAGVPDDRAVVNVVFDFGGVVFHWKPQELLSRLIPERTRTPQATQALFEDFFQGYGGDWGDFDRGTVEPGQLAERIARRTGLTPVEVRGVIDAVPAELQPIPGTIELIERLHAAGHALYFLSNMPAPYARHLEATHAVLQRFRSGVFSSRARLIKPEPAIFEHATRSLGIVAGQSLFIDDAPYNVEAARAAGWHALHFESPQQCEAALREQGLL
jgi:putative hydrolase of the HAD superfamily